jgi:hypothetical protein
MAPKKKPEATAGKKSASLKSMGLGDNKFPHVPPLAAAKPPIISIFSIDPTDTFTVAYYANCVNNYADVAICIHGTIKKGKYKVQMAKDGNSLMWHCATCSRTKEILKKIMCNKYRESSA